MRNYYIYGEHMKHFVKAGRVCGKGKGLQQAGHNSVQSRSEGLCRSSDLVERKHVIQDENTLLHHCSLLRAWRNCPAAVYKVTGIKRHLATWPS